MTAQGLVFLLLLSLPLSGYAASGLEEQRKYPLPPTFQLTVADFAMGMFHFHQHATYKNVDIYFDSEQSQLQQRGLSLRLRRVEKTSGDFTYALQLKSEMQLAGQIRMELEEKNLSIQKIEGQALSAWIDQFIKSPKSQDLLAGKLQAWLVRKKHSSLAPMQKLRELNIEVAGLKPVIMAKATRRRFHVYALKTDALAVRLQNSAKNKSRIPEFIAQDPQRIWLMEVSLDQATFRPPNHPQAKEFSLQELEVENKYRPRRRGTQFMNQLEEHFKEKWNLSPGLASKYLQAKVFFEQVEKDKKDEGR